MCGVLGFLSLGEREPPVPDAALACLRHRGPDAQRATTQTQHLFGHTLLSIIGIEPVLQPLVDESTGALLTFNGEIYNYLELRESDAEIRAATSGASDSEVLFAGLQIHGIDFVRRLNGMFAFAFIDRHGDAYLVRDRLGIKPLLYEHRDGYLAFASEHEALARLTGRARKPDPFGWYSYARARYPIDGSSFDVGVESVRPGRYLRVRAGRLTEHVYWEIEPQAPRNADDETMLAETEDLLRDSVRLRMRSDHSFCTFLSGGLDSSLLTAIAASTKPQLQTYSVAVEGHGFDESAHARAVADSLGTNHTEVHVGGREFTAESQSMWTTLRVPLGVPNVVAISSLAEVMARDHRCVLSGEGADEVFGGYGRIFLMPLDWSMVEGSTDDELRGRFHSIYGSARAADFESLFIERYSYVDHETAVALLERMFSPSELAACRDRYDDVIRSEFERLTDIDEFARLLLVFQRLHLPGLLGRLDMATMMHSVEARVPFLDHRLVELANSFPMAFKVRRKSTWDDAVAAGTFSDQLSDIHDIPKWPLRRIAEGAVDDAIIHRAKLGFPIPPSFYGGSESGPLSGYPAWVDANVNAVGLRM